VIAQIVKVRTEKAAVGNLARDLYVLVTLVEKRISVFNGYFSCDTHAGNPAAFKRRLWNAFSFMIEHHFSQCRWHQHSDFDLGGTTATLALSDRWMGYEYFSSRTH
jgi:hypothetical protein